MVTAGGNHQGVFNNGVNEAVLLIDAPGPEAVETVSEGFGLSRSFIRGAAAFFDQAIELLEATRVLLPLEVIFPALILKINVQGSISLCCSNLPARMSAAAFRRRSAFTGLDIR